MSVTVRNVLGVRVQLWWGLLTPGHSHDEELCPLLSQSGSLGRAGGGNTGKVQRCDLSQGLKWDQIVGEPRTRCPTRSAGGGESDRVLGTENGD